MSRVTVNAPIVNIFPARTRPALHPGDPFAFPPLQSKTPGSRPFRAERDLKRLPVPFIKFPLQLVGRADFSPPPPPQGFFVRETIPSVKLRGLGPHDSIILRTAIQDGLLDPARLMLSPLIPWVAQTVPTRQLVNPFAQAADAPSLQERIEAATRADAGDQPPDPPTAPPDCPDAPLQPDAMYDPPGEPLLIIEVKPNAGYVAFGQVLAYAWNWNRFYGPTRPAAPAILTDLPRAYLPGMAVDFGITLYTLGRLLVEPPPFPT